VNPNTEKEVNNTVIALCELVQAKANEEKELDVANPNSNLPQLVQSLAQLLSAL